MRRVKIVVTALIAISVVNLQSPQVGFPAGESAAGPGLSIRVSVNSVVLNASVRDRRSNRSINGLQLDNFEVYEDGTLQELQQMSITDAPFNLLLLMDVSGSTYSYLKLMKKAATDFLYELGENDRVAIASFNSKVRLLQDFTADPEAAAKAISRLHSAGGTAFYDALLTSVDQYMRRIEGRKAIVVFTDGVDNTLSGDPKEGSFTSFEELYSRLQETDTLIYTIFLNTEGKEINPANSRPQKKQGPFPFPMPKPGATSRFPLPFPIPSPQPFPKSITKQPRGKADADSNAVFETAREQLEAIADLTGGRAYSPARIQELSETYSEVADDLRIQYRLSYASSNVGKPNGWRSIRIEIKDYPGAVVRARRGYRVNDPTAY